MDAATGTRGTQLSSRSAGRGSQLLQALNRGAGEGAAGQLFPLRRKERRGTAAKPSRRLKRRWRVPTEGGGSPG